MLVETGIILGVGLLAGALLITAIVTALKKSRMAAELLSRVTAAQSELAETRDQHEKVLTETKSSHEIAMTGLVNAHAAVVSKHVVTVETLKSEHASTLETLKAEHVLALKKAEEEKLAAIAKVEGRITDFRDRQKLLMDEIFGAVEKEPAKAPAPPALSPLKLLKPSLKGQEVVALGEAPAKAEEVKEVAPEALAAKEAAPSPGEPSSAPVVAASKITEPGAEKIESLTLSEPFAEAAPLPVIEIPEADKSLAATESFAAHESFAEAPEPLTAASVFAPREVAPKESQQVKESTLPWLQTPPLGA
ncbi:MAG: hypothetical protein JWO82_214 [Akkermansiaceae bacterium]|nr:hypothetical protein [Akkermansiaceae bacterium]